MDEEAMSNQAGKGDDLRPVNGERFRSNYEQIFKQNDTDTEHPNPDDSKSDLRQLRQRSSGDAARQDQQAM
jgi:hypothetical protein